MKRFLIATVLLALATCSQVPAPTDLGITHTRQNFSTPEYDVASALARHSSGVYVVGETRGNLNGAQAGGGDAFIRKYDSRGTVLWGKQFGTTDFDHLQEVASDANDNAYAAGITYGSLEGSAAGALDGFLRKYSARGRTLWTRQFGSASDDYVHGVAALGRNVYVVGESYNSGVSIGFVKKFSGSGNLLWSKTLDANLVDQPLGVALDRDGNVYVVSLAVTEEAFVNVIYKYTPSGSLVWEKQLDFGGSVSSDTAVTAKGRSVFVAGNISGEGSYGDVRIIRLSTSGTVVWSHDYGEDGVSESSGDIDAYGNGVVFGESRVDFNPRDDNGYVYKIKLNGTVVWSKVLGTPNFDTTTAVLNTSYGVFAAGYTGGALGGSYQGNTDAYLARLRGSNGSTIWTRQ